jgi:serine/threonine protein kinase
MGHGSFGRVYIAIDQVTGKAVAVKRQSLPSDAAHREFSVYSMMRSMPCEHVLMMLDYFTAPEPRQPARGDGGARAPIHTTHMLYLVFELCENCGIGWSRPH